MTITSRQTDKYEPIRGFKREDIPHVAEMFQRLLLINNPPPKPVSQAGVEEYFDEIFFKSPFKDDEISSLVYEEEDGRIIGFLGAIPRRMTLGSRQLKVVTSFHWMVEPGSRSSLAGVQLMRRLFSGPQDLTFTDGAGRAGNRVWEGLGGTTSILFSQYWTRILRPGSFLLNRLNKVSTVSKIRPLLTPVCSLADAVAAKTLPKQFPSIEAEEELLTLETMLETLPRFSKIGKLHADTDEGSMKWLLERATQMTGIGNLKRIVVRDDKGELAGWYLYYLVPAGTSIVVYVAAERSTINQVLDHLFSHARRSGSVALSGRLEPQFIWEYSDKNCYFNTDGGWMLIHSRDPEVLEAIYRGEASMSLLDGEWSFLYA